MVRRCNGTVLRVCLMFGGKDGECLKDLYQDIMYDLCRGHPTFRGESDEKTWVYRVAFNRAMLTRRTESRHPRYVTLDAATCDMVAEPANDPLVERLHELIDLLGPTDKRLVLLYLDGLNTAQMSDILGCAESTVRNQLTKIRNKLKQLNENER